MKKSPISIERLKAKFTFDTRGNLKWKVDSGIWGRVKAGTIAGGKRKDGYLEVRITEGCFLVHHVVWALHTGKWPERIMDHINGNRTDNRICNLREAGDRINVENRHGPQRNNKCGFLGVYRHGDKWFRARINVNRKTYELGLFRTPEEASAAYLSAKRVLHEGCTI